MLSKEIIAVYSEDHMKPINILTGKNAKLLTIKTGDTCMKHVGDKILKVVHIFLPTTFQKQSLLFQWRKWHMYEECVYGKGSILHTMPLGSMTATRAHA
jgi:hypothetical protein